MTKTLGDALWDAQLLARSLQLNIQVIIEQLDKYELLNNQYNVSTLAASKIKELLQSTTSSLNTVLGLSQQVLDDELIWLEMPE